MRAPIAEAVAFDLDALPWTVADIIDAKARELPAGGQFYRPRHAVSFTDEASIMRLHRDAGGAADAVKVLSRMRTQTAKALYVELHRAGALFPRPVPSLPASLLTRERAA